MYTYALSEEKFVWKFECADTEPTPPPSDGGGATTGFLSIFFSYYSPFGYVDTLGWIDRPLSLYSLHTRVAYCCIRLTAEEWQWFPLHWRWAEDNNLLRHNLLSLMNSVLVHLHLGILNERILYLFFPLDGIERKKKHPPFNADEKFEAWKNFLKYFSSEESSFLFFLLLSK